MGSITCVQGQGEGSRGQLVLVPISEGIPQDVLESFGVQEDQENLQDLHLVPEWEQLTPLFSGEMREFLPARLGDLDLSGPLAYLIREASMWLTQRSTSHESAS